MSTHDPVIDEVLPDDDDAPPATPFAILQHAIGWSDSRTARELQVREDTVGDWRTGRRAAPPHILRWLARVDAALGTVRPYRKGAPG